VTNATQQSDEKTACQLIHSLNSLLLWRIRSPTAVSTSLQQTTAKTHIL